VRLSLNTIIRWETDGEKPRFERLLYVDAPNSEVWAIDVHYERAFPVFYRYEEIQNSILTNRAQIILNYEPYPLITLSDEELGEGFAEYIKRRDKAWELIKPLLEVQAHKLFNRKERRQLILELAKRTRSRENTIYFYLRRYWQRGCVKNALFPDWHKCGSAKDREDHGKKRGRPSAEAVQTGQPTGRNVTPQDREIFRDGIKKFLKSGMAKDLPSIWNMIKEQDYSTGEYVLKGGLEGDDIVPVLLPPSERPSFEQFKYYYYQERNQSEEIIALEGQNEYDRNVRPVLCNSTEMAFGPGAVYQIDATVGDIYLVNDFNREYLIGRPVIYIVIDTFSRLITGFAVTLEGPSWVGAKMALENAFKNKVEFCRELGINITEEQWPVQGKCESLLGDNGEIKSYNANSLVNPLGIRVSNAAAYRPDWKPIVERNFLTVKDCYVDFTPGMVRPKRRVRGWDYRFEARLSLLGFRQLFALSVIHYNNAHYLKDYPLDLHMIRAKVKPIPIHLWNYGMDNLTGRLREINDEKLRMNLLPSGKASIRAEGIYFDGMYYTCERAIREQWFERIKGKRTRHVEVVSESTVDSIHIRFDHGRLFETCQLTPAFKRFAGKDWYEVREYFAWQRQQAKEVVPDIQQSTAEFHAQVKRLVSSETKATEEALKAANLSKSARSKNIRTNRNQLKGHERKHGSLSFSNEKGKPSTIAPLDILHTAEPAKQLIRPPSAEGYVPPAKPTDEIRAARERAKGKNEQR
jgi:putative transposase